MRDEISAAVLFLVRLVERSEKCNQAQLEEFKMHLSDLLMQRFENHWFPEKPFKGQGYRCIRVNECSRRDAILERAALACGLKYEDLRLPVELTIWVDPKEVCCRFGEHKGSYCTLASFPGQDNDVKVVVENCPPEVKLDTPTVPLAARAKTPIEIVAPPKSPSPPASPNPSPVSSTPASSAASSPSASQASSPAAAVASVKDSKPKAQPTTPTSTASNPSGNLNQRTSTNVTSAVNASTANTSNHNNRSRSQNSPKQGANKSGGRKNWGGPAYQHPLQSWYSMLPPHPWMAASPPPFMLRSPPRSHPSHHRYHWAPHKPTLKV